MREVGVHDDDIVARCELQAVDVGGSESELAGARADLDLGRCVGFLELSSDFLRAVGRAVVDDDEFPVKIASGERGVSNCIVRVQGYRDYCYLLLGERLVQQPCYYGKIAALVVGGEEDGVLVFLGCRSHGDGCAADR